MVNKWIALIKFHLNDLLIKWKKNSEATIQNITVLWNYYLLFLNCQMFKINLNLHLFVTNDKKGNEGKKEKTFFTL